MDTSTRAEKARRELWETIIGELDDAEREQLIAYVETLKSRRTQEPCASPRRSNP